MANKEGIGTIVMRITIEELDEKGKLIHLHETEMVFPMTTKHGDQFDQELLEETRKGIQKSKETFDAFQKVIETLSDL